MTCDDYRERVTVHLADGSGFPGDHGASCPECARYAELARAAWDLAGRSPDEAPPPPEFLERLGRRPRRADLTLLRPGPLAAAAVLLAVGAILLVRAAKPGDGGRSLMEPDGMWVERYDLPAGADPARVAEEIERQVVPEAWGDGGSGLEAGPGWIRVRGPAEVQRAVQEHVKRLRSP